MKYAFVTLIFCFALSPLAQADGVSCKPVGTDIHARWEEATIGNLANGSQQLYQVRATGIYLTADLICSLENCVGFVNGLNATGVLKLGRGNSPFWLTIETEGGGAGKTSMQFICN